MKMKHKKRGYVVSVYSKRDRIIEDRDGFVSFSGNGYRGFDKVQKEVLLKKFERVA